MSITYRVIIEPDKKGFHGYVPTLKGCHTWGVSIAKTKTLLKEAIIVYLESLVAHGETIPQERSFETFETVDITPRRAHSRV